MSSDNGQASPTDVSFLEYLRNVEVDPDDNSFRFHVVVPTRASMEVAKVRDAYWPELYLAYQRTESWPAPPTTAKDLMPVFMQSLAEALRSLLEPPQAPIEDASYMDPSSVSMSGSRHTNLSPDMTKLSLSPGDALGPEMYYQQRQGGNSGPNTNPFRLGTGTFPKREQSTPAPVPSASNHSSGYAQHMPGSFPQGLFSPLSQHSQHYQQQQPQQQQQQQQRQAALLNTQTNVPHSTTHNIQAHSSAPEAGNTRKSDLLSAIFPVLPLSTSNQTLSTLSGSPSSYYHTPPNKPIMLASTGVRSGPHGVSTLSPDWLADDTNFPKSPSAAAPPPNDLRAPHHNSGPNYYTDTSAPPQRMASPFNNLQGPRLRLFDVSHPAPSQPTATTMTGHGHMQRIGPGQRAAGSTPMPGRRKLGEKIGTNNLGIFGSEHWH